MNKIETNILIERPVRDAFAYLSRLENMREWAGATEVRRLEPGRMRTGVQYVMEGKLGPWRVQTPVTLTDYQLNKQFATRSTLGPFAFYDRFIFTAIPGGTQISQETRVRSRGIFRLLVPLVTRVVGRRFAGDLLRVGELIEQRGPGGR